MLLLLASMAFAADTPVTLVGGLGGSAAPPSLGGFVHGRLLYFPSAGPVGVHLSSREGLYHDDARMVGGVSIGAHWDLAGPTFLRGGFLHHHETPLEVARENPFAVSLGSFPGIRHRSGLELGFGVDLTLPDRALDGRVGLLLDVGVGAFPDDNGPPFYVFVEQGWTIDVGPRR